MIGISHPTIAFDQFRLHIEEQLCRIGQLESGQFPLTSREMFRGGESCGFYFCIHGPRSVKLVAVYDRRKQKTIYYGTDGVRRAQESINVLMPSAQRSDSPSPQRRSA